jgi:hypothetical protein
MPTNAGQVQAPALAPLTVGGLVVGRAALVAALRLYVPQVVDVETLGGDRFLLVLAGAAPRRQD